MATKRTIVLNRRDVVARMLKGRGESLVVAGLGSATWDVAAAGDHPGNFYVWGAMGGTAVMGLGLAIAQPRRRVLVITGDGDMLMGLGSLATISVDQPGNLTVVVLDNERYAETGMQPGHTAHGVDLAGVANAVGFRSASTIYTAQELDAWIPQCYSSCGPIFAAIKVIAREDLVVLPPRDGTYLQHRFREALLGSDAII